jgi:hypothetical protein
VVKSRVKVMAVWTVEVQQTLGVSSAEFMADGLNHLTKVQLDALEASVKSHPVLDPKKRVLTCAGGVGAGGRVRVLLTVAGDDPTGVIAGEIRSALGGLTGVDVVATPGVADRTLHVVIQEQTTAKRTIGYTASYVTGTPCMETVGGKGSEVELKGQLGTYTDARSADLAKDLAGMMDQDLRSVRR